MYCVDYECVPGHGVVQVKSGDITNGYLKLQFSTQLVEFPCRFSILTNLMDLCLSREHVHLGRVRIQSI